jgi:hypothetical protein
MRPEIGHIVLQAEIKATDGTHTVSRMKYHGWLFLVVICTSLAQVPRGESLPPMASHGCCQECTRPCCTPDCATLPVTVGQPTVLEPDRVEAGRRASGSVDGLRANKSAFYQSFLEPVVATTTLRAPARLAPAASPPLFQVHCSFLI